MGQGGTPKTVLEDDEFFKIHSKALRADLNIVEVRKSFIRITNVRIKI